MKYINTFKTHIDIGFTDLAWNVLKKYRMMLERLINICSDSRGKEKGKRHPTVKKGAIISAGARVLGGFTIGEYAKIGAGAVVLSSKGKFPFISSATLGKVIDYGVTDTNNMGAAMAPDIGIIGI